MKARPCNFEVSVDLDSVLVYPGESIGGVLALRCHAADVIHSVQRELGSSKGEEPREFPLTLHVVGKTARIIRRSPARLWA